MQALNTEHWNDGEPTDSEKDFWEIAAMEAYSHLTEWKSLQYCSTVYIDEAIPPNLEKMWSEPLYQVTHSDIFIICGGFSLHWLTVDLFRLIQHNMVPSLVFKILFYFVYVPGNVPAAHDSQHVEAAAAG